MAYFPHKSLNGIGNSDRENETSRVIREDLDEIAVSQKVRDAVNDLDAEYVLTLDQGRPSNPHSSIEFYKNDEDWEGIDAITDHTPGFDLVLSQGDMRLYRVNP